LAATLAPDRAPLEAGQPLAARLPPVYCLPLVRTPLPDWPPPRRTSNRRLDNQHADKDLPPTSSTFEATRPSSPIAARHAWHAPPSLSRRHLLFLPPCAAAGDSSPHRPFLSVGRSRSSLWSRRSSPKSLLCRPFIGASSHHRRVFLSVSYPVGSVPVSVFVSRRNPNTSRSCRTSPEPSPTTPLSSLTGTSFCAGELRPPRRRASPMRVGSRDHARRVRRSSVSRVVKTYYGLGHCLLIIDRAMRHAEFAHAAPERALCCAWPRPRGPAQQLLGCCKLGRLATVVGRRAGRFRFRVRPSCHFRPIARI
jgi:hypothetical protein